MGDLTEVPFDPREQGDNPACEHRHDYSTNCTDSYSDAGVYEGRSAVSKSEEYSGKDDDERKDGVKRGQCACKKPVHFGRYPFSRR